MAKIRVPFSLWLKFPYGPYVGVQIRFFANFPLSGNSDLGKLPYTHTLSCTGLRRSNALNFEQPPMKKPSIAQLMAETVKQRS